jgi:hypothetical protein
VDRLPGQFVASGELEPGPPGWPPGVVGPELDPGDETVGELGARVGRGVGLGVGFGVGLGVGRGVGFGVGLGVGFGVGLGAVTTARAGATLRNMTSLAPEPVPLAALNW